MAITRPATYKPWTPATAVAADSAVVGVGPTALHRMWITNISAAAAYLMMFDAAAVPANGVVPRFPVLKIAPGQTFSLDPGGDPIILETGLCWAASSTYDVLAVTSSAPFQVVSQVEV